MYSQYKQLYDKEFMYSRLQHQQQQRATPTSSYLKIQHRQYNKYPLLSLEQTCINNTLHHIEGITYSHPFSTNKILHPECGGAIPCHNPPYYHGGSHTTSYYNNQGKTPTFGTG